MNQIRSATRWSVAAASALLVSACGGKDVEVDAPVPLDVDASIEYPVALWDRKVEGETEVLIHVNAYGDVDSALVAKTSGYAAFDSAAVSGARQMRFAPGRRGDKRIAMWTRIPVRFARDSSAVIGQPMGSGVRHD
jgi:TonB family protein